MTRYELFRKRIAPILFLGVVGLIAYDAWKKDQDDRIKGTVVLELGAAAPRVRAVEADLLVRGESVMGNPFRRVALSGLQIGDCRFEVRMPEPDGELRVTVDLGDARRQLSRRVHLEDDATVRIDLSADLARPPR